MGNGLFQVKEVTLAALLHDIGKAVQRSQEEPQKMSHSKWGAEWLKEKFKEFFDKKSKIILAVEYHHAGTDIWDKSNFTLLIYQADNWASSERDKKDCQDDAKYIWNVGAPLATPFSRISLKRDIHPAFWVAGELNPLPPIASKKPKDISREDYKGLISSFEKDFSELLESDFHPDSLLMLLEKYFSFIPSETRVPKKGFEKWPDISLFDHLKLTAAIASSYYWWLTEKYGSDFAENKRLFKEEICKPAENERPFLLVGGDISGVQKFIYTISSKGALRSLKGRSFFLELLTEHIAKRILDNVGLYRCNLIFAGGGHFYLLLSNTEKAIQKIKDIKLTVNKWLVERFGGALEVHICYESFHPDIFTKRAGQLFQRISQKFEESKRKPFINHLEKLLTEPLDIHESCLAGEGAPGSCIVCFRDDVEIKTEENVGEICDGCKEQYKLGVNIQEYTKNKIKLFEHFLLCKEDKSLCKKDKRNESSCINIEDNYYELYHHPDKKTKYIWSVNNFSTEGYAFIPSGLYQGIINFEDITTKCPFGLSRLAALRMDVDNLGQIFREGLSEEDQSFSRLAAISRALNLFFKYHLNALLCGEKMGGFYYPTELTPYDWAGRNVRQTGRQVAIIYAGGDDLFLMGHWLDICEAAFDIVKAFQLYTGNPELTLSGGIAMGHIKMPVYQYAALAGAEEKRAKDFERNGKGIKNALALFGRILPNEEICELKKFLNNFNSYLINQGNCMAIKSEALSRGFFYRIFNSAREFLDENNKDRILILPRLAYLLARVRKSLSPEDYVNLQNCLLSYDEKNWNKIFITTQWVIMSMRGGSDEETR